MAQKTPTAQVRVLRTFYYFDPLPDGTWTTKPALKTAGSIITMKAKDAIESRTAGKVEFLRSSEAIAKTEGQGPSGKEQGASGKEQGASSKGQGTSSKEEGAKNTKKEKE